MPGLTGAFCRAFWRCAATISGRATPAVPLSNTPAGLPPHVLGRYPRRCRSPSTRPSCVLSPCVSLHPCSACANFFPSSSLHSSPNQQPFVSFLVSSFFRHNFYFIFLASTVHNHSHIIASYWVLTASHRFTFSFPYLPFSRPPAFRPQSTQPPICQVTPPAVIISWPTTHGSSG